jgi:hypothetical protein
LRLSRRVFLVARFSSRVSRRVFFVAARAFLLLWLRPAARVFSFVVVVLLA